MKFYSVILLLAIPAISSAQTKGKTIPFTYESTSIVNAADLDTSSVGNFQGELALMSKNSGKQKIAKKTTETAQVEVSKVADLVTEVRDSICPGIKKGSFKVWLKFDANAKILGIGTSAEGGVEVNVTCG